MNAQDEKLYTALHEKEITRGESLDLTFATKELADALGARSAWDSLRCTRNAIRHLEEFRGKMVPAPELTTDEANLSAGLHTYMRKGMDCPLGTMLYTLIAQDRGHNIWYAFIKELNAILNSVKMSKPCPKRIFDLSIGAAESTYRLSSDSTDDLFMLSTLRMWEEDFENALEWLEPDEE